MYGLICRDWTTVITHNWKNCCKNSDLFDQHIKKPPFRYVWDMGHLTMNTKDDKLHRQSTYKEVKNDNRMKQTQSGQRNVLIQIVFDMEKQ